MSWPAAASASEASRDRRLRGDHAGDGRSGAEESGELVGGGGWADQVALGDVAAEVGEAVPLLARLDALGDDGRPERVRELDRAANDRLVVRVGGDAGD